MMGFKPISVGLIGVACSLLTGCGETPFTETVPVRGVVTWEGNRLDGGMVSFQPVEISNERPSRPSVARLKSDGTFEASSYREGDGLVPGQYHVAIRSFHSSKDETKPDTSRIPERFTKTATSGLSLDVPADSPLIEVQFDLIK
jgi:hypothetical protein